MAGQEIDHHGRILRSAGGPEDRAAIVVDVLDPVAREPYGGLAYIRVKSPVAVTYSQDFLNAVVHMQFQEHGPDHIVEPRAQTATGHDGRFGLGRCLTSSGKI